MSQPSKRPRLSAKHPLRNDTEAFQVQVDVHTAKTNLSDIIKPAEAGGNVVITHDGKSAVRLIQGRKERARTFGRFSNLKVTGDVLAPLDGDALRDREGS